MDKSETYIKICDCPEIQEKRILITGNYFFDKVIEEVLIVGQQYPRHPIGEIRFDAKGFGLSHNSYTWLPRQDQIQEMCKKVHLYYSLKNIQIFQVKHTRGRGIISWEQLWLAFYMHEKHKKVWNGKEWV